MVNNGLSVANCFTVCQSGIWHLQDVPTNNKLNYIKTKASCWYNNVWGIDLGKESRFIWNLEYSTKTVIYRYVPVLTILDCLQMKMGQHCVGSCYKIARGWTLLLLLTKKNAGAHVKFLGLTEILMDSQNILWTHKKILVTQETLNYGLFMDSLWTQESTALQFSESIQPLVKLEVHYLLYMETWTNMDLGTISILYGILYPSFEFLGSNWKELEYRKLMEMVSKSIYNDLIQPNSYLNLFKIENL